MIVMNLYYRGKNDSARRFVEEMERGGIADKVREEEGNERYEYFFSASDPATVLLIDAWKDQKALDEHHRSQMMKEIAALREKYDLHMTAERYVPDESTQDMTFIRR